MQRIKQRDLHDAECVLNFAQSMLRKNNEKECSNMNQDNNGSSCAGEICLGKSDPMDQHMRCILQDTDDVSSWG